MKKQFDLFLQQQQELTEQPKVLQKMPILP
jgi:hypothetical protein